MIQECKPRQVIQAIWLDMGTMQKRQVQGNPALQPAWEKILLLAQMIKSWETKVKTEGNGLQSKQLIFEDPKEAAFQN